MEAANRWATHQAADRPAHHVMINLPSLVRRPTEQLLV
jgi:hypothetical protein